MYISTKTYPNHGSTCFRQWRANSHCNMIHGYAFSIYFEFEAYTLDARNWVMDFGSLKPLKAYLDHLLDHTMLVAEDDPEKQTFMDLDKAGLADIRILPSVGCEALAEHFHWWINKHLKEQDDYRVICRKVEVREHDRNSAAYENGERHYPLKLAPNFYEIQAQQDAKIVDIASRTHGHSLSNDDKPIVLEEFHDPFHYDDRG